MPPEVEGAEGDGAVPPECESGERTTMNVGAVVIGRNEGERLVRCLKSVRDKVTPVVYVDSGSTDGSVERARGLGCEVVELDTSVPFSAARARNAGFERLRQLSPDSHLVQFVDGDCELDGAWIEYAAEQLLAHERWAIVAGRRRERHPEASVYNLLCDVEWDTPIGRAEACGGDFLVRAAAFAAAGGFDPTVIAGEEPELCYRLRRAGYEVHRLDHEMTLHDAAMTRFAQWWRRAERAGYAFALVSSMHWGEPGAPWLRQLASVVAWACFPVVVVAGVVVVGPGALVGFGLYVVLWFKIYRFLRQGRGLAPRTARLYALACVGGKFAEFQGALRAARDLLLRRERTIIEYKRPADSV
jgi:GT2 family glycosyltransferase